MKINLRRTKKAKLPNYVLGQGTFDEIGLVVSAGIVKNVKNSKQASGQEIKRNANSTLVRKRENNRMYKGAIRSLIDEKRRFIQTKGRSWRWWAKSDKVRIEAASSELAQLNRWVQRKGYTGWFGIGARAKATIKKIVRRRLNQIIDGGSGK